MSKHYGRTEPRLWTKPLRELTPATSLGFEVIDYARQILHIELYPWQQWLLIHALGGCWRTGVTTVTGASSCLSAGRTARPWWPACSPHGGCTWTANATPTACPR